MNELEAAWMAGLVDGEGTIYSRLPRRKNVVVELSMTDRSCVERVHALFPGRFSKCSHSKGSFGSRQQYRWSVDTNGAREVLMRLLPYLVSKKRQAEIALKLCERPLPDDHPKLVEELKALHQ